MIQGTGFLPLKMIVGGIKGALAPVVTLTIIQALISEPY